MPTLPKLPSHISSSERESSHRHSGDSSSKSTEGDSLDIKTGSISAVIKGGKKHGRGESKLAPIDRGRDAPPSPQDPILPPTLEEYFDYHPPRNNFDNKYPRPDLKVQNRDDRPMRLEPIGGIGGVTPPPPQDPILPPTLGEYFDAHPPINNLKKVSSRPDFEVQNRDDGPMRLEPIGGIGGVSSPAQTPRPVTPDALAPAQTPRPVTPDALAPAQTPRPVTPEKLPPVKTPVCKVKMADTMRATLETNSTVAQSHRGASRDVQGQAKGRF